MLGAAGLSVDSQSPDALCPPLEETRALVAARLGTVELEGTWHATYVLVHRTQGDFVSLSLFDPEGVSRLERQLPVQGGSCATLSGVIALVLERFFLRPEQPVSQEEASSATPPNVPLPLPLPVTPTQPAALPAASAVAPTSTRDPPVHSALPSPDRFLLRAGLWASNAWLAPTLGLERELSGPYWLGVNLGVDPGAHHASAFGGSLSVHRAPVSVLGVRELTRSPAVRTIAALELLGVVELAQAEGLAQPSSALRVVPGAGLRLGANFLNYSIAQPFSELTAAWLFKAAASPFQVGGQDVLIPPSLVFGLNAGIGTPF